MGLGLPILAYHKVDARRELGITSLSPRRFETQIRFLKHRKYVSISPQSLFTRVLAFNPVKSESLEDVWRNPAADTASLAKPVLITFDDGYEGLYTHAYPILKEYAFNAIIFVTTGYVGKYNYWEASPGPRFKHLDWTHIREMADDGICFGSHGVNHSFLTKLSNSAARHEIHVSKKELEDRLGRPIQFFSYPYGDYDERIMSLVQEAGYKAAFSLRPELLKTRYSSSDIKTYALPRIAIYLLDDTWAFSAKLGSVSRGSFPYLQKMKNRLINRCAYASMLVKKL